MEPFTPPMTPDRLLVSLNPDQRRAVTSKADAVVVVAGAGTGKTRVLAAKIVRLVRLEGALPESVLAFTFTRAAAAELRGRIQDALGLESERVEITTIHSWAMNLLRLTGTVDGIQVAEDAEVQEEIDRLYEGPTRRPEIAYCGRRTLANNLRYMESTGWNPERGSSTTHVRDTHARALVLALLARLYGNSLIPYGAILPILWKHLGHRTGVCLTAGCEACGRFASYSHVLVDEAQDLTPLEQRFVRKLGEEQTQRTYVLDPRQAVYGWRGAAPLKEEPGVHVIALRQGYRFGNPLAMRADAAGQECWSGGWEWLEGEARLLHAAPHETQVVEIGLEPGDLADLEKTNPLRAILRHFPPAHYGGDAILTRTNHLADAIVALEPARFHRVRSVVEEPLRAAIAFARLALNHKNPAACAYLLRLDGWETHQVESLRGEAGRRTGMLDWLQTKWIERGGKVPTLLRTLPEERAARSVPFSAVLMAVCAGREGWKAERDQILDRLERARIADAALPRALDLLADELRVDSAGWDLAKAQGLTGVGTVHGAKGREWGHVGLVTQEGVWPVPGQDPEEWRVAYVALTRASRSLRIFKLPEGWRAW